MSDFEIRLLQRAYDREPTMENAERLIAAYRRAEGAPPSWRELRDQIDRELEHTSDFHDMDVLSYDLTGLSCYDDEDESRLQEIMTWIEAVASFRYVGDYNWEYLIYLGTLDNEDVDVKEFRDVRDVDALHSRLPHGHDWFQILETMHSPLTQVYLPTPPELIPIIESAYNHGAVYLAFNIG